MGELKNRKWTDDNPKCPNGHLRVLCEVKSTRANGQVKHECNIRRRAKDRLRNEQRQQERINRGRPGTHRLVVDGDLGSNAVILVLVCGHTNYQLTKGDNHIQQQWCERHEDWFSVHSATQWGMTTEMTPLLSRHEINGCTTKTGCTPRCKSEEAPPITAAVIRQNNTRGHHRGLPHGVVKGKVLC